MQLCNMEYNKCCLKIDLKILQVVILTLFHTIVSKQSPTYHLLSSNGMPSSNPYQTITTPYKQQCISICATNPTKCRSFAIKRDAGNFKCFFFDATTSKDDLIPSTGVEYFMDIQSCQDWYRVGARVSGVSSASCMLPTLCIFSALLSFLVVVETDTDNTTQHFKLQPYNIQRRKQTNRKKKTLTTDEI